MTAREIVEAVRSGKIKSVEYASYEESIRDST
ncbi:hypothetical protein IBTHAUMO2_240096 [Nitrosopumilaceae archaeon]|nr:hypothetical protein IBTHAUMO2_240096 [Nitrosopumilaceae archaeon]